MLQEFEQKVKEYCILHSLFPDNKNAKILVALSGGGDSVSLLHVLVRIGASSGFLVETAHLNHALRGEESCQDELFCRDMCADIGIHLTVERLKDNEISSLEGSIETAARQARLSFLNRVAVERKAQRIATGHTLDDQTETVLQRIIRGTGPYGMVGILPSRNDLWVRPLLGISRCEVREYLGKNNISFREDSTNCDTVFFRNRIRHELIPFLQERFTHGVTGAVARLAELSRIQEEYLEKKMTEALSDCCVRENTHKILLDKHKFMGYHKVLKQRMIRHCLELLEGPGRDADMNEVENIRCLFERGRGTIDITSSIRCGIGKSIAAFVRRIEPFNPVPLKIPGETIIPMGGGRIISRKSHGGFSVDGRMEVLVGADIPKKYGVLTVGSAKRGESITPFGMDRTVKIRDIVATSSIPRVLRDAVTVVRAGAVPVWIPGLRSSEYLRIKNTKHGSLSNRGVILLKFEDGIQWC